MKAGWVQGTFPRSARNPSCLLSGMLFQASALCRCWEMFILIPSWVCLVLVRTTLPWLGTAHLARADLAAWSAAVCFAKYPVSGLSFHLGMVLFSPFFWHGGSIGNSVTFPLPCHQALAPRGRREGCFAGSSPCSYITEKTPPTNSEIHFGASRP